MYDLFSPFKSLSFSSIIFFSSSVKMIGWRLTSEGQDLEYALKGPSALVKNNFGSLVSNLETIGFGYVKRIPVKSVNLSSPSSSSTSSTFFIFFLSGIFFSGIFFSFLDVFFPIFSSSSESTSSSPSSDESPPSCISSSSSSGISSPIIISNKSSPSSDTSPISSNTNLLSIIFMVLFSVYGFSGGAIMSTICFSSFWIFPLHKSFIFLSGTFVEERFCVNLIKVSK